MAIDESLPTFVGRLRELEIATRKLAAGCRILTLRGPGGFGKTTLAKRIAWAVSARFGRVFFVDLTSAVSHRDFLGAIARSLSVPLAPGDAEEQLADALLAIAAIDGALLIFDNVEQLPPESARAIESFADRVRALQAIVTTRHPLGARSEEIIVLDPLQDSDAIDLFIARARRGRPNWEATPDDIEAIRALTSRLSGSPLAIELAAARSALLSPTQLLERIGNLLDLDTLDGDPDLRHGSLRSVITWSWDLLSESEREVLAQCSVFAGSFSLELAEQTVALSPQSKPLPIWRLLHSLEQKSLLVRVDTGRGDPRLKLLESVRIFGESMVGSARELEALRRRHAAALLIFAERYQAVLYTSTEDKALEKIVYETENLVAAHRFAKDVDAHSAAKIAIAMNPVLSMVAPWDLHGELIEHARRTFEEQGDTDNLLNALLAEAEWTRGRGDVNATEQILMRALDLAHTHGNLAAAAEASINLCSLGNRGAALAIKHGDAALLGFAKLGDRGRLAMALATSALPLIAAMPEEAQRRLDEALSLATDLGTPRLQALAFTLLARHSLFAGPVGASVPLFHKAIAIQRKRGDRAGEGDALLRLGEAFIELAEFDDARQTLEAAAKIFRELGNRYQEGRYLAASAMLELECNNTDRARSQIERALKLERRGEPRDRALSLIYLAFVHRHSQALDRALTALDEARDCVSTMDDSAAHGIEASVRATVYAMSGDVKSAAIECRRAQNDLGDSPLVDIANAFILVARAKIGAAQSPADARKFASEANALARRALSFAGQTSAPQSIPLRTETRISAALIERLTDGIDADLGSQRAHTLVIAEDGSWVSFAGGDRKDLGTGPAARVLVKLAQEREKSPGHGVSWQELAEAAWPDERIRADAAFARVRTTIARIRKLGLEGIIKRANDGYFIDPKEAIELRAKDADDVKQV